MKLRTILRAGVSTALVSLAMTGLGSSTALASGTTYSINTNSGTNMLSGSTDTGNHCDDCVTSVTAPFPVTVYGQQYNNMNVSSNGNIQFGSANAAYSNTALPNSSMGVMVAPYWDDMRTDQAGEGIFTGVFGAAPYRQFVVEWRVEQFATSAYANFEVIFNEANNNIVTRYGSTGDSGNDTTIGVQDGSTAATYAYNQVNSVFSGLQVDYVPGPPTCTTTCLIEETAPAIAYTGSWTSGSCTHTGCSANHTEKASLVSGDQAVLTFTGTKVVWKGSKGTQGGKAAVYVDGVLKATVSEYKSSVASGLAIYTSPLLARGTHTLKIKLTLNKRINIDDFVVTP